jgi:hypothetical protein
MAAPVLRATAELNSVTANSGTCNKPTGTVDGDIMFALVQHRGVYSDTAPSGWTLLGQGSGGVSSGFFELWYRVASSEGANYTWGFPATERVRILIATYEGGFFDTGTPIDVVSNTGYTTSNTTARAASMTVAAANSPLFFFACVFRTVATTFTAPTVPTTFTEDYDGGSTNPDMWNEVASCEWSGSGATGDIDGTISVSIATKHAFAVALNPSGGGGGGVNSGFFGLM